MHVVFGKLTSRRGKTTKQGGRIREKKRDAANACGETFVTSIPGRLPKERAQPEKKKEKVLKKTRPKLKTALI